MILHPSLWLRVSDSTALFGTRFPRIRFPPLVAPLRDPDRVIIIHLAMVAIVPRTEGIIFPASVHDRMRFQLSSRRRYFGSHFVGLFESRRPFRRRVERRFDE